MDSSDLQEKYMRRCIELALKGLGKTHPNPLVGAVIVHDGRIIGEGYHRKFGGPHAEVNAVSAVQNKSLLKQSVIYVNLEPCSHYGKTPPCSLLIRESGIPEVVVGSTDPDPRVSGRGISMLREAGIRVSTGILDTECNYLNRRFFHYIQTGRPYVILKWAESSDGFLDRIRGEGEEPRPNWITNETSRMLVHKWRSEEAGIMAGTNTVLTDNPKLDVRNWSGSSPVRILIDRKNRIGKNFHVKDGSRPTIIFTSGPEENSDNIEYINPSNDFSLENILAVTGSKGISSVIVEGGAMLLNSFINTGLWNEARVFTGRAEFRNGVRAPVMRREPYETHIFRNNQLKFYQQADL